jgi:hypothetical protein
VCLVSGMFNCKKARTKGQSGFAPDHSAIQGNQGETQKHKETWLMV